MTEADSIKWALLDLLKVLDAGYGGRLHGEFVQIAGTLGVVLPPVTVWTEVEVREAWTEVAPPVQPENNWKADQERKLKAPRN